MDRCQHGTHATYREMRSIVRQVVVNVDTHRSCAVDGQAHLGLGEMDDVRRPVSGGRFGLRQLVEEGQEVVGMLLLDGENALKHASCRHIAGPQPPNNL